MNMRYFKFQIKNDEILYFTKQIQNQLTKWLDSSVQCLIFEIYFFMGKCRKIFERVWR